MIETNLEIVGEHVVQPLGFLYRSDVDDARSLELAQRVPQGGILDLVVDGADHFEAKIRARETGDRDVGIGHSQLADDVRLDVRGSSGGEGEDWRSSESFGDGAE